MISCDPKIKFISSRFIKLIQGDTNPDGPGFKEEEVTEYDIKKHEAIYQKIYSGSYIYIPLKKEIKLLEDFTFITFIMPTLDNKRTNL